MYTNEETFTAALQLSNDTGIPFYFSDLVTTEEQFKQNIRFHDGEGDWNIPNWEEDQPFTWDDIVEIIDTIKESLAKQKCKSEAKRLLADTDWAVLPDAAAALDNPNDWVMYRAYLRALVASPVVDHVFQTPPAVHWNI